MNNQSVKNPVAEINYWIDLADKELNCFTAKDRVFQLFHGLYQAGMLKWYFLEDKKGIIVYCITDDFRGGLTVNELFMYIKPKWRGNIRLFKELINHLEEVAKEQRIKTVRIAKENVPVNVIKEILAHSDVKTTMRYVHCTQGAKLEALSKLNSYN